MADFVVSVNILKLENHISILEQELRETKALIECLYSWRREAMRIGAPDYSFFDKQISIFYEQCEKIYRRIDLILSMESKFEIVEEEAVIRLSEVARIISESNLSI